MRRKRGQGTPPIILEEVGGGGGQHTLSPAPHQVIHPHFPFECPYETVKSSSQVYQVKAGVE